LSSSGPLVCVSGGFPSSSRNKLFQTLRNVSSYSLSNPRTKFLFGERAEYSLTFHLQTRRGILCFFFLALNPPARAVEIAALHDGRGRGALPFLRTKNPCLSARLICDFFFLQLCLVMSSDPSAQSPLRLAPVAITDISTSKSTDLPDSLTLVLLEVRGPGKLSKKTARG